MKAKNHPSVEAWCCNEDDGTYVTTLPPAKGAWRRRAPRFDRCAALAG